MPFNTFNLKLNRFTYQFIYLLPLLLADNVQNPLNLPKRQKFPDKTNNLILYVKFNSKFPIISGKIPYTSRNSRKFPKFPDNIGENSLEK